MIVSPNPMHAATSTASGASNGGAGTAKKAEDPDQFMKLLLKQITTQNPLEPMSSTEMMQQMVGIETVDRIRSLESSIKTLGQNQAWQAAGLVGRQVELTNMDDPTKPVTGEVQNVRIKDSQVNLVVNGKEYSAALLSSVK